MSLPTELQESHLRSILKALTWRFVATLTTVGIVYVVSGDVAFAAKIGGIDVAAKIALYYFHERAWQLVPRGAIRSMLQLRKRF
jgi:uncharacterized membrane protein